MSDQQLNDHFYKLAGMTDNFERQLRADHPHLAAYLDMTILVRPLWQYGFDVLGEIYATAEEAEEARRAAVMHHLIEVDRRKP